MKKRTCLGRLVPLVLVLFLVGCPAFVVDTVGPTLTWLAPTDGSVILASDDGDANPDNGAQFTIDLLTDAPEGDEVTVTGLTLTAPPLLVDATGHAVGATTLAEGASSLAASVVDSAGNITTAVANVLVDVRGPTLSITPPVSITDVDPATPGFQLDLEVTTTYAENGQLIQVRSDSNGGVVDSALIATAAGGDLGAITIVRTTLPPGMQNLTAEVADESGNFALSMPVSVDVAIQGCGLAFVTPASEPILVDATGFTGDPATDPKRINAQLMVLDVPGCADPMNPATVRVRIGCGLGDPDVACTRIYTAQVDPAGFATFTDIIEFFDGELTTMHAITDHPVTGEVCATPQRTVIVDLSPPLASITRPGVMPTETILSLRDSLASPEWSTNGTNMVGPLVFDTNGVFGPGCQGLPAQRTRCAFTVQYSDGTVLQDGAGNIQDRAIDAAGPHTTTLSGVQFPTMDESAIGLIEVRVVDQVGNVTVASVPINVDGDPPSSSGISIDRTPYLGLGGARNGRADMSWTVATDDTFGGGAAFRYEIRAMADQRASRAVFPGAPRQDCGNVNWSDIMAWESRPLVAELSGGETTYFLDAIGLDELWTVGVRAFDEADNWSPVSDGLLDTRLTRSTFEGLLAVTASTSGLVALGDVNGDGHDDLLVASGASGVGGGLLMLGEADPDNPVIPGNPFTITAPNGTGDTTYFGSSAIATGNLNGDAYNDFAIASPGFSGMGGNNYVYIYLGTGTNSTAERVDLVTADSAIVGPTGQFFEFVITNRVGWGNIYDLAGGDTYDDLLISANDLSASDLYVVLGRDTWPAITAPIVLSGTGDNACASNVIKIAGVNPPDPALSTLRFGMTGAVAPINDDIYADIVAGASYPGGGTSSAQYVFYGGIWGTCPTAWDLSDADEILVNGGGGSGVSADTQVAARFGEHCVGVYPEDTVEVFAYNPATSALETLQTVSITSDASDIRFGVSVGFAANLDQVGGVDLVASGPARPASVLSGRVYVVASGSGDPRFAAAPDFWMSTPGATQTFGGFVAAGFDFNGDGLADVAVTDTDAATVTLFW